jgi:hypothetical protein
MVLASSRSLFFVIVPHGLASVMRWDWIGAGHVVRHRIGGSRVGDAGEGKQSGGSHTRPAPDLAVSQAPTCEGVVGTISEMLVGQDVNILWPGSSQKSLI